MSCLNKPSDPTKIKEVYHIMYTDTKGDKTHRGINIYGKNLEEILKVFRKHYSSAHIVYMMDKSDILK